MRRYARPKIRLPVIGGALAAVVVIGCGGAWAARAGDAAAGATTFLICRACHEVGPGADNATGPVLNGVIGRKAGTYPGYDYSAANRHSGITWTVPMLAKYLADPQKVVPGTKMTFSGLQSRHQIADVIAYLEQFSRGGKDMAR